MTEVNKQKLWEYAQKMGTTRDNFEKGLDNSKYASELLKVAEYMGWVKHG